MEKNISEEELLLRKRARRRLLGAITLVMTAIIVLPMIFDDEPKQAQREIVIELPAEDVIAPSPTVNLVDELPIEITIEDEISLSEQSLLDEQPVLIEVPEDPFTTPVEQASIPIPGNKPEQESSAPETTIAVKQPTTTNDEFVVQLGAFSDHSKAMHQQQNLVTNGINAYTEIFMTSDQEIMRVRVGPFSTRRAAEDELSKLKRLGLNGVVTAK